MQNGSAQNILAGRIVLAGDTDKNGRVRDWETCSQLATMNTILHS